MLKNNCSNACQFVFCGIKNSGKYKFYCLKIFNDYSNFIENIYTFQAKTVIIKVKAI